jgi:omega-amidase
MKFKIAVCQIRTELDQDVTLEKAGRMIAEAAANGAQVVALPEMFNCPYSRKYFHPYAQLGHEKTTGLLSKWAKDNNIIIIGGSIPETDGDKIYNTSFVFDENGNQIAKHRKVHLFDVDLPGMRFKESATFTPGDKITVFDTKYGRMGVAVCFDIRFPELFRAMAVRGAQVIFLPAQFGITTGSAHWEMALSSRAVDNEVFVVGASAARYEGFSYECWGHSTVCDPFGNTIATCDEKEQILYCDIDLDQIDDVRRRLPTFLHLRRDVYTVAE